MPSTFRWRCRPIHSSARQNSPKSCVAPGSPARRACCHQRTAQSSSCASSQRQEGVAQQRGHVVGDRPAHRVLEVEDARVRLPRHHQVARHPVAVHGHQRLRQRAVDEQAADAAPRRLLGRRSRRRRIRAARTTRETAPARAPAAPRRTAAARPPARAAASARSARMRVAHQARRPAPARRPPQRVEVERAAEVGEQQEALLGVGGQHPRRVQAGGVDESGHVHEGAHVLLRRRRVHHDQAAGGRPARAE